MYIRVSRPKREWCKSLDIRYAHQILLNMYYINEIQSEWSTVNVEPFWPSTIHNIHTIHSCIWEIRKLDPRSMHIACGVHFEIVTHWFNEGNTIWTLMVLHMHKEFTFIDGERVVFFVFVYQKSLNDSHYNDDGIFQRAKKRHTPPHPWWEEIREMETSSFLVIAVCYLHFNNEWRMVNGEVWEWLWHLSCWTAATSFSFQLSRSVGTIVHSTFAYFCMCNRCCFNS